MLGMGSQSDKFISGGGGDGGGCLKNFFLNGLIDCLIG